MNKDWWLGRTPEQQAKKAARHAKFDEDRQRRGENLDARRADLDQRRAEADAVRAAQQTPEAIEARIQHQTERAERWRNRAELFELSGLIVAAGLFVLALVIGVALFVALS